MVHLRDTEGKLTADPVQMRESATGFFHANLYSASECNSSCVEEMLQGLPKLRSDQVKCLSQDIGLKERTMTVPQLFIGRAPGIDGLPAEF